MSTEPNRLAILDYSRGIAALAVVFFHWFYKGPVEGWVTKSDFGFMSGLSVYGYLGVHFFFIISGFVITISAVGRTWQEFLLARAIRLFPALWACATITFVVLIMLRELTPTDVGLVGTFSQPDGHELVQSWLASLTLVPTWFGIPPIDGSYWSLIVEVHFYLAIALLIFLKQQQKVIWILLIWLVGSELNVFYRSWRLVFALNLSWAPFLAAGVIFSQWFQKGLDFRKTLGLTLCLILSLIYVDSSISKNVGENHIVSYCLIILFFSFFAAVSSKKIVLRASKLSQFSGAITYPLYLVHQIVGYALFNFFYLKFEFVKNHPLFVMILLLVLCIVLAYCVHIFIERPVAKVWRSSKRPTSPVDQSPEQAETSRHHCNCLVRSD